MSDTILITRYISSWFWHIIAVMFFLKTISFLIVHLYPWMIAMAGVSLFAEFMAWKRQNEVYKMGKENES